MRVRRSKKRAQHSVGDKMVEAMASADDRSSTSTRTCPSARPARRPASASPQPTQRAMMSDMAIKKCAGRTSTDEDRPRSSGIALIAGLGPEDSIYSRDAENISAAMNAKGWDTVLCISPQARKDDIHEAFVTLRDKAWPGCSCMLYFGAHADADAEGQLTILPVDQQPTTCPTCGRGSLKAICQKCGTSLEWQAVSTGVSFEWLRRQVTGLPVQRALLLVDFCYSGQIVEDFRVSSKRFWKERSLTVVSSCGAQERSCCWSDMCNSPFATIVIDALSGAFIDEHCAHEACPCRRHRLRDRYKSQGNHTTALQLACSVEAHMPTYERQHPLVESRGSDFTL